MEFFNFSEFACRCCGQIPPSARENIEALVDNVLDPARRVFGGPVSVNSGYRCPRHNAQVGGVGGSQHLKARLPTSAVATMSGWRGLSNEVGGMTSLSAIWTETEG